MPLNQPLSEKNIRSIYLIAICGTGMTALAGMLKARGYEVTGSDANVYPPMSTFLKEIDIQVKIGYDAANLEPAPDLVVIGNAMSRGNPEVEAVLDRKLNYISLPFALREFFIRDKYSCVVAGTHGKTTTSSLFSWVLEDAGRDPSFFIGGIPENFGQGFKLGSGDFFVSEGDEYDSAFFDKRSKFLHYLPDLVILNNIEFDHADIFRNMEDIEITFSRLINLIPGRGHLVACWDDENVRRLCKNSWTKVTSFGLDKEAEWRAQNIQISEKGTAFEVLRSNEAVGYFEAPLYGEHMVRNCLAVIVSGMLLGLHPDEIGQGLKTFKNVKRRLQFRGEGKGIRIFDDFAHHPTEIGATISAIRGRFPDNRIWAVFEARTATSKRKIFEQRFVDVLSAADCVVLTPLHQQDKVPEMERLSLDTVCRGLSQKNVSNWVMPANEEMRSFLKENLISGDIVLFMSNGDFNQIPANLLTDIT